MNKMNNLEELGKRATEAKYILQALSAERKNEALQAVAKAFLARKQEMLSANEKDLKIGEENGMHPGLLDRLRLTDERICGMADGLMEITELSDPIGEILERFDRPNGLHITKLRVPFGVIGIIYESRPNVTADAFGLCFKTGNAVILKGGKDAIHSNIVISEIIRETLEQEGIVKDAIQLITDTDRQTTNEFMRLSRYVDVLIPRGGAGLIRAVVENSTIPVIETGTGNCHIYIDEDADIAKAVPIIINAKTQRIGVCNSCESLVIHEKIADRFLPALGEALREKNVEMRGDERVRKLIPDCLCATEEDYGTEYLDYIISMKTVSCLEEAIAHINRYTTRHSDAIVTENEEHAQSFLQGIDSACVYVNASTRFTDGFEFGFGAEIGISTQKLHARGPMGLKELTTYKYTIVGDGQTRP
jgi:glutamate-5-semialdehyde dehydrogenase